MSYEIRVYSGDTGDYIQSYFRSTFTEALRLQFKMEDFCGADCEIFKAEPILAQDAWKESL